jgi:hypothetical protein
MENPHRAHVIAPHVSGRARWRIQHAAVLAVAALPCAAVAQDAGTNKTFFDYILPTPITCPLTTKTWGCTAARVAAKQDYCGNEHPPQKGGPVVPRDTCNGMESAKDPPDYYYWDGKIIRSKDGLYHLISDRWPDANQGFQNYTSSAAVHAVSDAPLGPYKETGYCYSFWSTGDPHRGHNTTVVELLDGTYALTTGEGGVAPFTVWTSKSLEGPWTACPNMRADGKHEIIDTNGLNLSPAAGPLDSNVAVMARPDGQFQILQRRGMIGIASNVCGPYKLQKPTNTYPSDQQPPADIPSIYPNRKKHTSPTVGKPDGAPANPQYVYQWGEDPAIWFSGGKYHALYDYPIDRVGYHLTSLDGIHDWKDEGFAYDPRMADKIFVYTDGTTNGWYKMERPAVLMENGHVTHLSFAVSDVDKDSQIPAYSSHGSKIVVMPFDGVRFDCETGQVPCDEGRDAGTDTGGRGGTDGGANATGGAAAGAGGGPRTSIGGAGGSVRGGAGGSGGRVSGGAGGTGGRPNSGGAGGASGGSSANSGGAGGNANSGGAGGASGGSSANSGAAGGSANSGGAGGAGAGGSSNTMPSGGAGGMARGGASGNASGAAGSIVEPGGSTGSSGCGCSLGEPQRHGTPLWYSVLGLALLFWRRRRRERSSSTRRCLGSVVPIGPRTS